MRTGHKTINVSIAGISTTRAIAYSHLAGGPHDAFGPLLISNYGAWLSAYALLWAISALMALWAVFRGKGSASPLLFAILMFIWSGGYFTAWWVSELTTKDWMTGCLYLGVAGIAAGYYRMSRETGSDELVAATSAHHRVEVRE